MIKVLSLDCRYNVNTYMSAVGMYSLKFIPKTGYSSHYPHRNSNEFDGKDCKMDSVCCLASFMQDICMECEKLASQREGGGGSGESP